MGQNTGYIIVTLKVHREENQYVSECEELGVASCGSTIEEAFDRIRDAITVYLQGLEEIGAREETLKDLGLKVLREKPDERQPVLLHATFSEYVAPFEAPVAGVA